jgi:hypothetical protein
MTACIYCPNDADSLEHPLPAAFGEFEFAPLLDRKICGDCNTKRLGLLDEQLTRCGPEAILRKVFHIQGRPRHDKVNPFYRGSAGGKRLRMKAFDSSLGAEVELESLGGNEARQLCQMVFVEPSGLTHHLPISDNIQTPDELRAAYDKLGVADIAKGEVHLICDPDERVRLEALILAVWPLVSFGPATPGASSYEKPVIDIQVTDRYFRAVAKIGFHYFLTQFPEFSGSESCFEDIRRYITEERGPEALAANDFIGKRRDPLLGEMRSGAKPDGWIAHVVTAQVTCETYLAQVQLFVCKDYPAPAYTVRLGTHPKRAENQAKGHAYVYFKGGRSGKFSGRAHPLSTTLSPDPSPPLEPVIGPFSET